MSNVVRYANPDDDFELREEMIPMRDGVKLHALTPNLRPAPMPILRKRSVRAPAQAAARAVFGGFQFQGKSSAMRFAAWLAMRASTSAR